MNYSDFEFVPCSRTGTTFNGMSVLGRPSGKNAKSSLVVHCPICALDKELHGDGVFLIQRSRMHNKRYRPCGCGRRAYTTDEYRVLVARRSEHVKSAVYVTDVPEKLKSGSLISLRCVACDHEWKVSVSVFLRDLRRCRHCATRDNARSVEVVNEIVNDFCERRGFVRTDPTDLDDYKRGTDRTTLQCSQDHDLHTWSPTVNSIKQDNAGCVECANKRRGFQQNEQGLLYLTEWKNEVGHKILKFGVTNKTAEERISQQAEKTDYEPTILKTIEFDDGAICWDLEKSIKSKFKGRTGVIDKADFGDGFTETISIDDLDELDDYILSQIN